MTDVLFLGRKPVAARSLEYLVERSDVNVVGVLTDNHLSLSPTADVAMKHAIPIYGYADALAALREGRLRFDIGVSMLYWKKLKDDFLTVPSRGVINFHPAPLPQYKGTAGYNLAILEGLSSWAVTAHYMDEDIDTGGIIRIVEFDMDEGAETALSLERKSQPMLLSLFKQVMDAAIRSKTTLPVTPNIGGKYVSREEMEAMKEIKSGDDLSRKIRAFWFPPYDGAYQVIENNKYTLVDRTILDSLGDPDSSSLFTAPKK